MYLSKIRNQTKKGKTVHLFLSGGHVLPCIIKEVKENYIYAINQEFNEIIIHESKVKFLAFP